MFDLSLNDVAAPTEIRLVRPFEAKHLNGAADRSQWVPQLMGQCRQELILAAIGLLQLINESESFVSDCNVVTEGFHESHFICVKLVLTPGSEGKSPEQPITDQQRVAGVGTQTE